MAEYNDRIWMPIRHAANAAGVPERSAYRWVKRGIVPAHRSGRTQLVEVEALRAYAARPHNGSVAEATASGAVCGGAETATTADMDERLCFLEESLAAFYDRLVELEGRIGDGSPHA